MTLKELMESLDAFYNGNPEHLNMQVVVKEMYDIHEYPTIEEVTFNYAEDKVEIKVE